MLNNIRTRTVGKFAIYAVLLTALYYSVYLWLIQKDWPREDYNYCYLIPLVVLYLIWEKKEALKAIPAVPSWCGLLFLVPGLALYWLGDLAGEFYSPVSYTHLRAHETVLDLVCRLLLDKTQRITAAGGT